MTAFNRFIQVIQGRNDILLAVFLVAIIFMMILPLPTILVDTLIAVNMSIAVILLMLAVYIKTPLELSAFPAILLATTLFRLALSITTTRLILLEADAGDIVYTFGNFVVGGNLVVGGVIFLILTIVQFLVITKGSERVAEVSARFSLDSMPGKQMSIDGDMRAGVIDQNEATQRRSIVEKESQLYGSMDGAMKFVKGDAIAGLIITFVNILGGITIGITQKGMSAGDALGVYSILTIGDGLVAQIPALFISITAGFIVTRVTSEKSSNLGNDIGSQVTHHPKALMIGGCLLFGFALIPGFPSMIFIMLSAVIGGAGYYLNKKMAAPKPSNQEDDIPTSVLSHHNERSEDAIDHDDFSITAPLILDVAASAREGVDLKDLNKQLKNVRRALYMDLGVPFPGIHLRFNENLQGEQYKFLLNEVPVAEGILATDHLLVLEEEDQLMMQAIEYENRASSIPGNPLWVPCEHRSLLQENEIDYMDGTKALCYHLSYVLKRYAEEFLGIQECREIVTKMEGEYGELVKETQRLLPLQKIAEILQRLVSEDISIRNLRSIFEALVEWGQKEKDTILLTEYVRNNLNRQISYKYSNGQNILPAYLLEQDLEEKIRGGIRQTSSGSYLALDPSFTSELVEHIKTSVGDIQRIQHKPVMIVSMDIRRYVRKLLELEVYDLSVISFQELARDINIQSLGRLGSF